MLLVLPSILYGYVQHDDHAPRVFFFLKKNKTQQQSVSTYIYERYSNNFIDPARIITRSPAAMGAASSVSSSEANAATTQNNNNNNNNTKHQRDLAKPPLTVLHIYDSCPFCTRVRLVAGWKNLSFTLKIYGYGDVDGPKKLTGEKILPVLEYPDANGKPVYKKESLDLIEYLDGYNGDANRTLAPAVRDDLKAWLNKAKPTVRQLTRGAVLKLPIKDWENEEDVAYAVNKYTRLGFDYEKAEAEKEIHLAAMAKHLEELDGLLHSEHSANAWGRSLDDILLIPDLRTLTSVKDVKWPAKVSFVAVTVYGLAFKKNHP